MPDMTVAADPGKQPLEGLEVPCAMGAQDAIAGHIGVAPDRRHHFSRVRTAAPDCMVIFCDQIKAMAKLDLIWAAAWSTATAII